MKTYHSSRRIRLGTVAHRTSITITSTCYTISTLSKPLSPLRENKALPIRLLPRMPVKRLITITEAVLDSKLKDEKVIVVV